MIVSLTSSDFITVLKKNCGLANFTMNENIDVITSENVVPLLTY